MNKEKILDKTKEFARKKLEGEGTGHDWWHVERVWKNAVLIAKNENADLFIVELAALLHDIADWKFHGGDINIGPKMAKEWLESLDVDKDTISRVCEIVETISFKGRGAEKPMATIEGKIVRDADRLDAIGAIGIARCFAYGGSKNRSIYNPEGKPKDHKNFESYKKGSDSSLYHFYEKLLLLKDLMLTNAGKNLAKKRHEFMENYLKQFYKEWEGET